MDRKIEAIKEIYDRQKAIRAKSDALRYEAYSYTDHRISEYSVDDVPFDTRRLYSASGKKAIDVFVQGIMSSMMSPTQKWFGIKIKPRRYTIGQDVLPELEWTSYAEQAMMDEFQRSNLYSEATLASYDCAIGGYSCMAVQENEVDHRSFFTTFVPWRCYFDRDMYKNWNLFIYEYSLSGYEMLERFPDMPKRIREKCLRDRSSGRNNLLWVVCDRSKVFDQKGHSVRFSKEMRFASLHIYLDGDCILDESGYNEFPVTIHNFREVSDSQYGVGLVMSYIEEFRKLNKAAYEYGLAIAKINHRAWNVPVTMKDSFSDDPESRNYYSTPDMLPIQLGEQIDMNAATEMLRIQIEQVKTVCYNEYMNFLTTHDQVYTATQVNAIKSESLSQISPLAGNIENQKIIPVLKLTMLNMLNNGRLDGNRKLAELDMKNNRVNEVEFTLESAMAKQLRSYTDSNAISYMLEFGAAMNNVFQDPSSLSRRFNVDNMIRLGAVAGGATAEMLRSDSEVRKIEKQQAELQQQQIELENSLKQSEINRNNAGASNLNNMAGMNGGAQ